MKCKNDRVDTLPVYNRPTWSKLWRQVYVGLQSTRPVRHLGTSRVRRFTSWLL